MPSLQASWRPLLGGALWLAALAWLRPSPWASEWAELLLLLAPLVLVPLALELALRGHEQGPGSRLLRLALALQVPAAALLALSFAFPQGSTAGALALPWLLLATVVALAGVARLGRPGPCPWAEFCLDAGLIFLPVGAGWALLSRAGQRPLGFDPAIVLLTGVHFHFAAFLLPLLTGLAGRAAPGSLARATSVGIVVGVPLVAVGITTTQLGLGPALECVAAWFMALSGLGSGLLHLNLALRSPERGFVRLLWGVAGVSLLGGMTLAALYGSRPYLSIGWLDLGWMRALHGTANALGFGVAGVLGWVLAGAAPARAAR